MKLTSSYSDSKCSGAQRSTACSTRLPSRNSGEPTLSRISTKLSSASSAMASVFGLRRSAYMAIAVAQSSRGLGEAAVELDDVLEGAVHPLTEERDDGVGGVAEQRQPAAHPRPDAHRDERADRVAGELAGEVLEQLGGVGVVAVEAGPDGRRLVEPGEPRRPVERPEQRGGEAVVEVGQGDHHRVAPRPDVQGAGIEGEVARRGRGRSSAPCTPTAGAPGGSRRARCARSRRGARCTRRRRRSRRRGRPSGGRRRPPA